MANIVAICLQLNLAHRGTRRGAVHRKDHNKLPKINRIDRWPVTYRWAAMGTLLAYSALGVTKVAVGRSWAEGKSKDGGPVGPQALVVFCDRTRKPGRDTGRVRKGFGNLGELCGRGCTHPAVARRDRFIRRARR